jgi:hypothetical protein
MSFICCESQTTQTDKLYMCSCEENPDLGDSINVVQKVKYTYLVYGKESPDCCLGKVSSKFKGFKEIWSNQAPDHPKVWRRNTSDIIPIGAKEAQSLGCAIEGKIMSYANMDLKPNPAKDYYPELVN